MTSDTEAFAFIMSIPLLGILVYLLFVAANMPRTAALITAVASVSLLEMILWKQMKDEIKQRRPVR